MPKRKPLTPEQREAKRVASRAWWEQHGAAQNAKVREYRIAHRDEVRARDRAKYAANGETERAKAKERWDTHREKLRALRRAHYAANRDTINAKARVYRKKWRATHRDEIKTRQHKYRTAHRDEINTKNRAERTANRETYNAQLRAYHKAHPEVDRNIRRRRRAKQKGVQADLTSHQWELIQRIHGFRCAYCGKKPKRLEQDHIIPISKGGPHTASNIVPACRSCNSKKHVGPPLKPVQPLLLTW